MMSSLYRANTNFAILRINRIEIMMGGAHVKSVLPTGMIETGAFKNKTRRCVTRSLLHTIQRVLEDAKDINRRYFVW